MKQKQSIETHYCGIDISGETLDVYYPDPMGNYQSETYPNSKEGFKILLRKTGIHYHFVMESTGVYHLPLCFYLESKKSSYSVVNALQIKRYIQMHLERTKSDKKDAKHIYHYGVERSPEKYVMPDRLYFECRTLNNAIESMTKEITSFKNKLYSLSKLDYDTKEVEKGYKHLLKQLGLELQKLEDTLAKKLAEWQPDLVKQVSSVVGIGKRATSILIVSTQGFKNTETYQQLICYAG